MQQHPLRVATQAGLWLVALAAALLAAVGFGVHATVTLRARAVEFAQLRAIGLSRRSLTAVVGAESLLLCLLGGTFGIGIGALLGPLGAVSADGTPPIPSVVVHIPWADTATRGPTNQPSNAPMPMPKVPPSRQSSKDSAPTTAVRLRRDRPMARSWANSTARARRVTVACTPKPTAASRAAASATSHRPACVATRSGCCCMSVVTWTSDVARSAAGSPPGSAGNPAR